MYRLCVVLFSRRDSSAGEESLVERVHNNYPSVADAIVRLFGSLLDRRRDYYDRLKVHSPCECSTGSPLLFDTGCAAVTRVRNFTAPGTNATYAPLLRDRLGGRGNGDLTPSTNSTWFGLRGNVLCAIPAVTTCGNALEGR